MPVFLAQLLLQFQQLPTLPNDIRQSNETSPLDDRVESEIKNISTLFIVNDDDVTFHPSFQYIFELALFVW